MKICNVILCLNAGGAENAARLISNYFSKKHKVSFLLLIKLREWPIFYKLNKRIKLKDLNLYKKSNNFFEAILNNFKRIIILRKNIQIENPDILIAHCSREIVLTYLSTFFLKKKIIGYIHSDPQKLIKEKSILWLLLTYVAFSFVDNCIVFSNQSRLKLPFLARNKAIVIPNVSSEFLKYQKNYSNKNIIMVGSLIKIKNHEFVIDNFKHIISNFPEWKLQIIGDGPLRKKLEKIIYKNNLSKNIFILGNKINVSRYFNRSSIYLLSSISEGMNLSLIEAIKFGLPVISSNCSSSHDQIIKNDKNGYIFEKENNKQFLHFLEKLISDVNLREKFGKNSLKYSKQLENKKIFKIWDRKILKKN